MPHKTLEERFWSKVAKAGSTECWEWLAGKKAKGYGHFHTGTRAAGTRKQNRAHRVAYELEIGPIPEGMCVLHQCDNPPCVNPAHLFLGTIPDNQADMVAKNRQAQGERNGQAVLTLSQVREIRRRYETRGITQQQLADDYGVSQGAICFVVTHKRWK